MPGAPLGVGVVYCSGLGGLLNECASLFDVVEVEPQTLWYQDGDDYRVVEPALAEVAALPQPKLLHGIGFPVGGSRRPDPAQLPPWRRMIERLDPPWISEHLSFNRAAGPSGEFLTGFLLPPRQSPAGVSAAAASIRSMAEQLPAPVAVETGVNYLQPRDDELDDGEFVRRVVEAADCGILLDLHNLWTNERNGRQPVREFLEQLPLQRVWEVHLAGGSEHDGYWLDSHSGAVPAPLLELAETVLPRLPNLRAVIFELFPAYLARLGVSFVREEVARIRELWDACGPRAVAAPGAVPRGHAASRTTAGSRPPGDPAAGEGDRRDRDGDGQDRDPSPRQWEDALGGLVIGRDPPSAAPLGLDGDPGVKIWQQLVRRFRTTMVRDVLKLSTRLIEATSGEQQLQALLSSFWQAHPPELFAAAEADAFAAYLERRQPGIPLLQEVLRFERGSLATLQDGEVRLVAFDHDPLMLLRALAEGRLPDDVPTGNFEVEITPAASAGRLDPDDTRVRVPH